MVIDTHFTEFIHDNGDPAPMVRGQYSVQQCGFAGAQKTGKNGHRNSLIILIRHSHQIPPRPYFEKIATG
jgi:hypothetical protein